MQLAAEAVLKPVVKDVFKAIAGTSLSKKPAVGAIGSRGSRVRSAGRG